MRNLKYSNKKQVEQWLPETTGREKWRETTPMFNWYSFRNVRRTSSRETIYSTVPIINYTGLYTKRNCWEDPFLSIHRVLFCFFLVVRTFKSTLSNFQVCNRVFLTTVVKCYILSSWLPAGCLYVLTPFACFTPKFTPATICSACLW